MERLEIDYGAAYTISVLRFRSTDLTETLDTDSGLALDSPDQSRVRRHGRGTTMRHLMLAMIATLSVNGDQKRAEVYFFHRLDRGVVAFEMEVTPAAWHRISHGLRIDSHPQVIAADTLRDVSALIDSGLRTAHLCPGRWRMSEVLHLETDGVVFVGMCGTAI
jgi:hypothetical protein